MKGRLLQIATATVVATLAPCGGSGRITSRGVGKLRNDGSPPAWLQRVAAQTARDLGDRRPNKVSFALGHIDTIVLEGRFVCGKSCFLSPGARPPVGTVAVVTVDPRDRGVVGFWLRH
jgi:hypothetical protein